MAEMVSTEDGLKKALVRDIAFIKQHWTTSSDCIQRLWRIKSGKEYRLMGFSTWESFVGSTFDGLFTVRGIDMKLKAAKSIEAVAKTGSALPKNNESAKADVSTSERAARKLASVPEEKRAAVVERATKPGRGGVPTVTERAVEEAAAEIEAEESGEIIDECYRDKEGNIVERPDVIEALQLAEDARMDMAEIEGALRRFVAKWKKQAGEQDNTAANVRAGLRYMVSSLAWCIPPKGAEQRWIDQGWISQGQFEAGKKIRGEA